MRTRFRYISVALAGMLMLAGCVNSEMDEAQGITGPHIRLTVSTCDPQVRVKSDVAGEDSYNENLMNTIHYFFFAKGSTSTAVVKGSASGISKKDEYTEEIPISSNDLNGNLFNSDRKCDLFVIANAPESMAELLSGNPTLAQLRAAAVISNMNKVPQSNFVMVYDDELSIGSRIDKQAIDVEIGLERLACKFTFKADVKKSLTTYDGAKEINWTADTGEGALYVTFGNGINKTTPAGFNKAVVKDEDYFESTPVELEYQGETNDKTIEEKDEGGNTVHVKYQTYSAVDPIYTYPMDWVFTDQFEPYILFDMVWNYNDGGNQHQEHRYYKMVLGQQSITSNDWYVITAKLTALGNLLPRDPLVLFSGLSYSVYKWNDAFQTDQPNTPANIKAARYLMVPQTEYELQNETTVEIPFLSSHLCDISNITVKKNIYFREGGTIAGNWPDTEPVLTNATKEYAATEKGFKFTVESDKVLFSHELNNTIGSDFDHSPYDIRFTITQTGATGNELSQTITLTQYPAIWIELKRNSSTNEFGYAYYNGNNTDTGSGDANWDRIRGRETNPSSTSTSASPFMIVFHISSFQATEDYIIGDPRSKDEVDIETWWTTSKLLFPGKAKYTTNRKKYESTDNYQLAYYYPTIEDEAHRNYIAPVLRVSSAVGRQSTAYSYKNTLMACATYQEDGYPAGRWRLPTAAEAYFVNNMAGLNLIPPLYTYKQYYWFAGGWINEGNISYGTGASHGNGNGKANTRCVYDEWYWSEIDKEFRWNNSWTGANWDNRTSGNTSDDVAGKGFVWGDMPRNYTHPSSH